MFSDIKDILSSDAYVFLTLILWTKPKRLVHEHITYTVDCELWSGRLVMVLNVFDQNFLMLDRDRT